MGLKAHRSFSFFMPSGVCWLLIFCVPTVVVVFFIIVFIHPLFFFFFGNLSCIFVISLLFRSHDGEC